MQLNKILFIFSLYIVTRNLVYDLIVFVGVIKWICPLEKRNFYRYSHQKGWHSYE